MRIKEEVTKQIEANVVRVTNYPSWLANIVLMPKKDGKIRICVDYRDLNKASPKDDFPLPNIHILIDSCAKHELQGQYDKTGRKEQAIYYLSKKFTPCEAKYTLIERTCCALTLIAQKLMHYILAYTTHLISQLDPLKYIFQKPMPTGKLAKWKNLLSEFDILYITQRAIKGHVLADHVAENPVDGDYEPLTTYFPDEEVLFVREDIAELYPRWRMFFDGAGNFKGVGIGAVLISESGQHYPASTKIRFSCTNNMAEYEACIFGIRMVVNLNIKELLVIGDSNLLIHQVQGEWSTKNVKILSYLHFVK
ncbi:uncharacterized protein [Nicotiana tomentosiformis]|uniref:uncharacterized protein n=1 Tax=Nicotiana tomentosiformis TaxID=4098 RepID=UPI00388C8237